MKAHRAAPSLAVQDLGGAQVRRPARREQCDGDREEHGGRREQRARRRAARDRTTARRCRRAVRAHARRAMTIPSGTPIERAGERQRARFPRHRGPNLAPPESERSQDREVARAPANARRRARAPARSHRAARETPASTFGSDSTWRSFSISAGGAGRSGGSASGIALRVERVETRERRRPVGVRSEPNRERLRRVALADRRGAPAGVRYAPSASGYASARSGTRPARRRACVRLRVGPFDRDGVADTDACAACSVSAPSAISSTATGARPVTIAGRISPLIGAMTAPNVGRPFTRSGTPECDVGDRGRLPGSATTRAAYWFGMSITSKVQP